MPEKSGEIFVKFFGLRTVDGEAAFYRDATSCWDRRTGFEIDGRSKVHRGRAREQIHTKNMQNKKTTKEAKNDDSEISDSKPKTENTRKRRTVRRGSSNEN